MGLLERFAGGLPVREGVEVLSVTPGADRYRVITADQEISARGVVIGGGGGPMSGYEAEGGAGVGSTSGR